MKNLPIILNIILFLLVGHLYYLNSKNSKQPEPAKVIAPAENSQGVRIAYVNGDTLDAKYEWLKKQKEAIEQRLSSAERSMANKEEALMRDASEFQEKLQSGNMTQAEAEKTDAELRKRAQKLEDEKNYLSKSLSEDQKKAFNDLYEKLEEKLKHLSSQIGYDYILSYSRGGQILLASDSLDITNQVLELLNAKEDK
ncbi:MAG: OmpH family outer membrane protein [Saprospiraceae bacterium]